MNSFVYFTNTFVPEQKPVKRNLDDQPGIIQGADLYNKVAPVSSLTGKRENVITLLTKLTNNPEYSRAIQSLLQEIPSIRSDKRLSDEDRINLMMERLSTGTPAEDDKVRSYLEQVSDVLFKDSPQNVVDAVKDGQIDFKPSDVNVENV